LTISNLWLYITRVDFAHSENCTCSHFHDVVLHVMVIPAHRRL